MQLACIHQHRTGSPMVFMQTIDLTGAIELSQGIAADGCIAGLIVGPFCFSRRHSRGPAIHLRLDTFAQVKCQQAFYVSGIDQGSREVTMVDVAAGIDSDRTLIMLEGDAVFTSSADDASSCRLNIAQGDGVVRVFEDLLRMVQQLQGFFGVASLKDEPRLLDLNHCRQFVGPHSFSPVARLHYVLEGFAVFTLLAMSSSLPKVGEDNQVFVGQFPLCFEDELQQFDRSISVLPHERPKCFRKPKIEIIAQWHPGPHGGGEPSQQGFDAFSVAMSNVQPLGRPQSYRRTGALNVRIGPAGPGLLQEPNSISDAALLERLVQLFQEMDRQDHTAKILVPVIRNGRGLLSALGNDPLFTSYSTARGADAQGQRQSPGSGYQVHAPIGCSSDSD